VTAPHHLPGCPCPCPSSAAAAAALVLHVLVFTSHEQPTRFGSAAIDMRCRRRPRLGMGWLRAVLSPLRKLWCRVNAVQQRKSTVPCPSHALLCSVLLLRFSGF